MYMLKFKVQTIDNTYEVFETILDGIRELNKATDKIKECPHIEIVSVEPYRKEGEQQ